jgi:hypothetical protein
MSPAGDHLVGSHELPQVEVMRHTAGHFPRLRLPVGLADLAACTVTNRGTHLLFMPPYLFPFGDAAGLLFVC